MIIQVLDKNYFLTVSIYDPSIAIHFLHMWPTLIKTLTLTHRHVTDSYMWVWKADNLLELFSLIS